MVVDAVPDDGGGGGLVEDGCLAGGDVETLPVQVGVLRSGEGELRTARCRRGTATDDGHAGGIGQGVGGKGTQPGCFFVAWGAKSY